MRQQRIIQLRRVLEQLESALDAYDPSRSCLDVVQHLNRTEIVIADTKRELINEHIDRFLLDASHGSGRIDALAEIKALSEFL